MHAVLGTSDSCVATHASDLAVALVALDTEIRLAGASGTRTVRLDDFYRLPGDTPEVENDLRPGELITEVVVPRLDWARRSTYVKVRDRQSYEFALCSAAVALNIEDSRIVDARVAVGGVATRPWRLTSVEAALRGGNASEGGGYFIGIGDIEGGGRSGSAGFADRRDRAIEPALVAAVNDDMRSCPRHRLGDFEPKPAPGPGH